MKLLRALFVVVAILCASQMAYATTASVATADNEFWIWGYNAQGAQTPGVWNWIDNTWPSAVSINLAGSLPPNLYFAVRNNYENINTGNPAGFLGQVGNLVTNPTYWGIVAAASWGQGATTPTVNPTSLTYGTPTSYGTNGVGPWGTIGGISSTAQWLWTAKNDGQFDGKGPFGQDNYAIVRTAPEPIGMALFTLGGLSLAAIKRMKKGKKTA